MKTRPAALFALLLGLVSAASAQDFSAAMQRCRAMDNTAERLACYDAIPLATAARPAPATATAGAAATPAAKAAPAPATASTFGLVAPKTAEPEFVESQILGAFEGWESHTTFKLANGQYWQIADGSRAAYYLQSPKVKVRKGALGAFYLDIDGAKASPRVKRVQ